MGSAFRPVVASVAAAAVVGACLAVPEGEGIPRRITDQGDASADTFVVVEASAAADASGENAVADPHALVGVDPPHGPFVGGRLAVLRGNGFSSKLRVWFGDMEVTDVVRADPTRAQVVVPPGLPGDVDVRAQNGDDTSTSRLLVGGYTYDPFYAEPSTGPTSGGTLVRILGKNVAWDNSTQVRIADKPCLQLGWVSAQELSCAIPPNPAGSATISVTRGGEAPTQVYDAFTYADSDNGYKGGLSGGPLNGALRVAVYDAYKGEPIPGAFVVAGNHLDTAIVQKTDGAGATFFQDSALVGKRSVTIAKECFEPTTFVDVPVDTVTVYLVPVITPACMGDSGDVPPVGGRGS
ncbi:MAG: IPT/TIG domain-containing protein, partial [Polyangiaceae bacterium]|nr:IPT/TIG domain-containing protein [Polyangiaceae bacterium]